MQNYMVLKDEINAIEAFTGELKTVVELDCEMCDDGRMWYTVERFNNANVERLLDTILADAEKVHKHPA